MLWASLVTLDNLYVSSWFLYQYGRTDLQGIEKDRWLRRSGMVYAPVWFIDRYIYYALVQCLYWLATSLYIVDSSKSYYAILALHNPFVFNRYVIEYARHFFAGLKKLRYNIAKVVFLKTVADILQLVPQDETTFIVHFEYITLGQICTFLLHYVFQLCMYALYQSSWKWYPVYRLSSYYYYFRHSYLYSPLALEKAQRHIRKTIGTSWEHMNVPAFVNAIQTVSRSRRHFETKWARWLHKLSVVSCMWTFSELTGTYWILWLLSAMLQWTKMVACYRSPTAEHMIHVLAILVSPCIGYVGHSYLLGAILCTFPVLHSVFRYVLFAYYSYTLKQMALSEYMCIKDEASPEKQETKYEDIVKLPYSDVGSEYVMKVSEPNSPTHEEYVMLNGGEYEKKYSRRAL